VILPLIIGEATILLEIIIAAPAASLILDGFASGGDAQDVVAGSNQ
jgi:hypothetical protein